LSAIDVPITCTRPPAMMATRSESESASSIECVVRITTRLRFTFSMMRQTDARCTGSMPVVHSSSTRISGSPTHAIATLRRRFMPPLNVSTRLLATSSRSTWRSKVVDLARDLAAAHLLEARVQAQVLARRQLLEQQVVLRAHADAVAQALDADEPKKLTSPAVLWIRPSSIDITVVLPAPFGPRMHVTALRSNDSVTSCAAATPALAAATCTSC
jgi:hypothetical protein